MTSSHCHPERSATGVPSDLAFGSLEWATGACDWSASRRIYAFALVLLFNKYRSPKATPQLLILERSVSKFMLREKPGAHHCVCCAPAFSAVVLKQRREAVARSLPPCERPPQV